MYGQETDEYEHEQQMTEDQAIQQKIAFIKNLVKNNGGAMWVDDEFPANDSALYKNPDMKPDYDDKEEKVDIVWKRPQQIVTQGEEAVMFKEGMTSGDVKQGALDDCWLLGSFLLLGTRPQLLHNLIIEGNSIDDGFAVFRFFKNGRWVTVFVDTLLPFDNASKHLVYGSCTDPCEFWVALMEKAYAKLHGCYEALNGGTMDTAMVDLTGGVSVRYDLT